MATALDFRVYFPRIDADKLVWANYVYAYFTEGIEGVHFDKEVQTQVRVRLGEGSFGMGPRPDYLSVYFSATQYTQAYRQGRGRCSSGKYTINIPYYDDDVLDEVKKLVRKALKSTELQATSG